MSLRRKNSGFMLNTTLADAQQLIIIILADEVRNGVDKDVRVEIDRAPIALSNRPLTHLIDNACASLSVVAGNRPSMSSYSSSRLHREDALRIYYCYVQEYI